MENNNNSNNIIELNNINKNNSNSDNIIDPNNGNKKNIGFGGKKSFEESANIFSKLTFWWGNKLVWFCYKNVLELSHLYDLASYDTSEYLMKKIGNKWENEKKKENPSFSRAALLTFGRYYIVSWFYYSIYVASSFIGPVILKKLVEYVVNQNMESNNQDPNWGYYYGLILLGTSMVGSLCNYQSNIISVRMGDRLRSVIVLEVYKKALKLSNSARGSMPIGKIVNLMSTDAQRMIENINLVNAGFFAIPQIIVCLILLYYEIGWITFVGFGFMLLCIPLNGLSAMSLMSTQKQKTMVTDERLKITTEIFQSIKIIKLYAWEDSFAERLLKKREKEVQILFKFANLISVMVSFMDAVPTLASILIFSTYYAYYKKMDPAHIFAALSYLNILRIPMSVFPIIVAFLVQMKVSGKRVTKFLLLPEIIPVKEIEDPNIPNGLYIKNGSFCWNKEKTDINAIIDLEGSDSDSEDGKKEDVRVDDNESSKKSTFQLKNINLEITGQSLTMIVGSVGSGKSSLINALLGEMDIIEGDIGFKGKISYASQQAWIFNGTLRDNILFGNQYDEELFKKVIKVCALERDLELFPQGDLVEIGERGINLSGGQKQRVSIARAVYSNSDIYIFDDPLSALDSHVSKHIFYKCFKEFLSNKTVILSANQLNYIPFANETLVLKDGEIIQRGTFKEIIDSNSEFSIVLKEYGVDEINQNSDESLELLSTTATTTNTKASTTKEIIIKEKVKQSEKIELKNKDGSLTQIEEREQGAVSWKIYWIYATVGGGFLFFTSLFLFFMDVGSRTFVDYWLSKWQDIMSEREFNPNIDELSNSQLLYIYIGIGIASVIISVVKIFVYFNYAVRVGESVFKKLFNSLIKAPMHEFFDVTPLGRIISRFSRDQDDVDMAIAFSVSQFLGTVVNVLATLVLIAIFIPIILAPMVPIVVLLFVLQYFYRHTSRELQRVEAISRSPIFSHFTETLNGVETIRSYRKTNDCIIINQRNLDSNNKCYLALENMNQWLNLRLDCAGNLITFLTCVFITVDRHSIAVASAGLILSYALSLTAQLNQTTAQFAEIETKLNSLERIYQYIEVDEEAPKIIEPRPDESWPQEGSIKFENVVMSYRKGLDPVIKGVSLDIKSNEKIGIVGRTGAGKSSILLTLFRLAEASEGRILIDGLDISRIGLKDLRSNLSIIPQDPVVFAGTIRDNLDPFNQYSDQEIWETLEDIQLNKLVKSMEGELYSTINEGGSNISVGERQLLCLGRTLLKKPKILVLDEATASVDGATDALIQKLIREKLNNTTLLIIAHRLNTIIDSDRIVVLDSGKVGEFDTPYNLLQDKDSLFGWMIDETGPSNSQFLRNLAKSKHDGISIGNQLLNNNDNNNENNHSNELN